MSFLYTSSPELLSFLLLHFSYMATFLSLLSLCLLTLILCPAHEYQFVPQSSNVPFPFKSTSAHIPLNKFRGNNTKNKFQEKRQINTKCFFKLGWSSHREAKRFCLGEPKSKVHLWFLMNTPQDNIGEGREGETHNQVPLPRKQKNIKDLTILKNLSCRLMSLGICLGYLFFLPMSN